MEPNLPIAAEIFEVYYECFILVHRNSTQRRLYLRKVPNIFGGGAAIVGDLPKQWPPIFMFPILYPYFLTDRVT